MARTCTACGETTDQSSARWCGRCGARLAPGQGTSRPDPATAARQASVGAAPLVGTGTLVSAPAPSLHLDDLDDDEELAPPAPWSTRARALTSLAVVLAVLAGLQLRPDPEPVYDPRGYTARGDEARSGVVSLAPLEPPTRVLWTQPTWTPRPAGTVAAAGEVAVESAPDGLLAVREAGTGEVRWVRRDTPPAAPQRAGNVVVRTDPEAGDVVAYDLATGATRWSVAGLRGAVPVAAIGDEAVLLRDAGDVDTLTRVEAASGEIAWSLDLRDLDASIADVQVTADAIAVWGTSPFGLAPESGATHLAVVVDPVTGQVRWVRRDLAVFPGLVQNAVAVGGDRVVLVDRVSLRLVDLAGRERAVVEPGGPVGHLAATDDVAVGAISSLGVVGVDLGSGRILWRRPDLGGVTDLRTTSTHVLARTLGRTLLLDARTGTTVAEASDSAVRDPEGAVRGGSTRLPDGPVVLLGEDTAVVLDASAGEVGRWPLLGSPVPPPAAAGDRVYLGVEDGLEVRDAGDGEVVWSFATGPSLRLSSGGTLPALGTPAVATTTVVVAPPRAPVDRRAGIVALERTGGIRAWDRDDDRPMVHGPLTLLGDTTFVPVDDEIHGYHTVNGRRSFAAVAPSPRGPLVVSASRVIGGPSLEAGWPWDDTVVAVLRRDRSESWRATLAACSAPALAGDTVVFGTRRGVAALAEASGERRWEVPTDLPVCTDPVVVAGQVVFLEGASGVRGVEATTGETRWAVELPAPAVAPPVAAGDTLLVPLLDGQLVGLHLGGAGAPGAVAWSVDLGAPAVSSPVVADGRVVVPLRDGRLVALGS